MLDYHDTGILLVELEVETATCLPPSPLSSQVLLFFRAIP